MTADLLGPDPADEWQNWSNSLHAARPLSVPDAREAAAEERLALAADHLAAAARDIERVRAAVNSGHLPVTSGGAA